MTEAPAQGASPPERALGNATPAPLDAGGREASAPVPGSERRRSGLRFLARRAVFYLVTAFFAIVLNFAIPRFMPGNPGLILTRQIAQQTGAPPNTTMLSAINALYGNPRQNLPAQFIDYVNHVIHLNFGLSLASYPTPVKTLVLTALPWTLLLVGITTVLGWIIGTALGAWTGWHPGGRLDSVVTSAGTFINAVPSYWLALLALALFSFKLGLFPSSGAYDPTLPYSFLNVSFDLSVIRYGLLPGFMLVFLGLSGWQFTMRNVMVTTISEDYVQLARAKGLPQRTVLFRYAARNAMLPNVTGLANAIGGVIGGVLLTEIIFNYPGMGDLLYTAIQNKDFPVMQAVFFMITFAVLVSNFIADSIYVLLDPRTREAS